MEFHEASREGAKLLACLYAESGGGKTFSALLLARGLVGPKGRIGMIDTERGRGELYADDPRIGKYSVLQLSEPYSPKRFREAIETARKAGFDALVIDSVSAEWEGIGGVLDMAHDVAERRFNRADWNKGKEFDGVISFGDWKEPKTEHKHFIDKIMTCDMHVITCARAQYKSRQIDKADYEKYGITSKAKTTVIRDDYQTPIQEERFIFEMTVHLQMSNQHPGVPIITKCPEMLLPAFEPGKPITVATGGRIAAFYADGAPSDQAAKDLIGKARKAAKAGLESYQAFFVALDSTERRTLVNAGEHDRIKAKLIPAETEPEPEPEPDPDPREDPGPGFTDDDDPGPEPLPGYTPPNFDTF